MKEKKIPIIVCSHISIPIIALLLIVLATLPVVSAEVASADWQYHKSIEIDPNKVAADLTDFPVLINLASDDDLANHTQENGDDIVFTNSANTVKFDHEIEKFVKSTGELVAWVRIPSLSSTTNTTILMWYGNSGCGNQENATGVWDANYRLVQHLNESCASSGCIEDSTSNNNDGTPYSGGNITNLYTSSGKMNGADDFDGSNDYVGIGDLGIGDNYTAEVWINADALTGGNSDQNTYGFTVMASSATVGEYPLWLTVWGTEVRLWAYEETPQDGYRETTGAGLTTNTWFHIAVTAVKSGDTKVYVNGMEKLSFTNDGEVDWTNSFTIADLRPDRKICFDGTIDEVRISAVARNAAWIKTSYNNQNNPSTFYTVGSQESAADWSYRKPINITNTGNALTDYQVKVHITDTSKMSDNGADLRFTNGNNTVKYPYWVENWTTNDAYVWVNVSSIPTWNGAGEAPLANVMYMWYNNPDASSESNGIATFLFFDDFQDSSYSNQHWEQAYETSSGNWTVANGCAELKSDNREAISLAPDVGVNDYVVEAETMHVGSPGHAMGLVVRGDTNGNLYHQEIDETGLKLYFFSGWSYTTPLNSTSVSVSADTWYHVLFRINGSSLYAKSFAHDAEVSATNSTYSSGRPGVEAFSETARFDDFRVRKYASPEPTISVGAEQNAGPVPPVPDLPAIILFGAGLLAIMGYAALGRRLR